MEVTLAQFQLATGSTAENAQTYYDHALEAMDRFSIGTVDAVCAWCATLAIESQRLTKMEEDLFYKDAARLAAIFPSKFPTAEDAAPYVRNPHALSMKVYNGFHGRGGIQLSWEKNYRIHGDRLDKDFVAEPTLLLIPRWSMLSAGSYWDLTNCNEVADNMDEVTRRVNGPRRLHLAERIAQRDVALGAFA